MTREITREPKVALCRLCHGTGEAPERSGWPYGPGKHGAAKVCTQCEGSGRVTVRIETRIEIEPYRTNR